MKIAAIFLLALVVGGCGTAQKAKRVDELELDNVRLRAQVADLARKNTEDAKRFSGEKQDMFRSINELESEKRQALEVLEREKEETQAGLRKAMKDLEESLSKEIEQYKAKLELTERGLVVTFISEVFFDSGKDIIKEDGYSTLDSVAKVLIQDVPGARIAVEGHTDNEPIKYSGWKSNWELSCARALAVVHYFIEKNKLLPERLSAVGYGEYKPVVSNDTPEGRQENRRVEIVILPKGLETGKQAPSKK
ncbi:MAG: OmpA family protein [Candidatus Omnitrophota bacterium]